MTHVYTQTRQKLGLGRSIGRGGEAVIYELPQKPHMVAKIYHTGQCPPLKKLHAMIHDPPEDPMRTQGHISIAWISQLLESSGGDIVGCMMPKIRGGIPIHKAYNPVDRRQCDIRFTWRHLHRVALNLAKTVAAIHAKGYVIGDLNESNILVHPNTLISIVDTDSFQVVDPDTGEAFRCPVGKPEYTPPELQGLRLSEVTRTSDHDNFALSVLIFLLLMEGSHPFRGQDPPVDLASRIRQGLFPYPSSQTSSLKPPLLSVPFDALHPEIRQQFRLCFAEGHYTPCRPSAARWAATLAKAEAHLVSCARNKNHIYSGMQSRCTWCQRTTLLQGRDPFPEKSGARHRSSRHINIPPITAAINFHRSPSGSSPSISISVNISGQTIVNAIKFVLKKL